MFLPFRFGVDASDLAAQIKQINADIVIIKGMIMATQAEIASALNLVLDQLNKANAEIVAQIAALEAAIAAAGNSTPEVDAAMAALKEVAQKLDDINPDVPV